MKFKIADANKSIPAWCLSCDPDKLTRWTSGDKDIDDCIKSFQLRTWSYENVIEWIPFDRLSVIEEVGKGGFGSVYKATCLDGIRKVDDDNCKRAREISSIVALKTLSEVSLKEFENHMKYILYVIRLKIYGLTQSNKNNKYFIVLQYADNGNLHKFLRTNFQALNWATKLKLLYHASIDLSNMHYVGYIHADFHSGNILQDKGISTTLQSYITDLGLSKNTNENDQEDEIYGVMPYVAPEVLLGQKFTKSADIYGFGIILSEMSTGQRPFDGQEFDQKLAVKICKGLRPEFAPGTPKCYIELAEKCMNSDPQKRPEAFEIRNTIADWLEQIDYSTEINKQFLEADKVIKSLPISKHPDEIYTSKIIRTKLISKAIKGNLFFQLIYYLSQAQVDSAQINLDVTEI
ncbi:kinase-like domain-containing protein [Gigaspora rosea]|uniref:Kinase-like domain-containing protein n=1 Tax=Gigaspora rosea TaxID=44941 RepID=A0A397UTG7_9GLOM|nr:kinase-like domain-containing protein [Gigaspora rosea]